MLSTAACRRSLGLAVALALGAPTTAAAADKPTPPAAPRTRRNEPDKPEKAEPEARGWPSEYPTFRWWEYVSTGVLLGGSLALRFLVDVSGEPTWRSGLPGDDAVYDGVFITSPSLFNDWRTAGDIGYLSSYAWSALDPLIAGLAYDWETALQMTLMNLEAFSVYSTILSVSQIVVKRERPSTRECGTPREEGLGISCSSDNQNVNRSFIGGHTGTIATAATLTCLHHSHLPLWGSPAADALPCMTWSALTFMVFTSRTVTGQHNFSDNLLGVGVGVMSGLVPWALHYAYPIWERVGASDKAMAVRPTAVGAAPHEDGVTLNVSGILF
jgi:hypothetical protein